ncbi:ribokinase [Clostridium sartagoforme]|uniref:Ribokinase n=1 Tax=Clostridium sartagoforme TaxID=84031 RepID=A0A4S2DMM5_9CLOT|nr:ribokinase [Clostridium sartagoforme]TGY42323.1 ribokinase [Clostridium sartagoforme]
MKVLNFGSLNIDYVYSVNDFVQKGETISSDKLNVFSGGKGLNQSLALSKAGVEVYHAGAIGEDGLLLEKLLRDNGVNTKFLRILSDVRTGNAIIQKNNEGDNCIILYGGSNKAISKEMVDDALENFEKGDWLLLQNEISEISYIVEKAYEKGMKIVLNPSPMNDRIFDINLNYIHCFILNEVEAEALTEKSDDKEVLLKKLQEKFPHAEIILTLGEDGSLYVKNNEVIEQKAYKVNVVDTTAAGDTFTGYYLAERLNGKIVKDSLDTAAKAAAIAVSRNGAAPSIPQKDEVLNF